jgi:hypothetical protein
MAAETRYSVCTTSSQTPLITDEVNRLAAAVQNAIDRGFSVITCLPREKGPYPRYSPHAINSATRNLDQALAPYSDNIAANYGVACGISGLCVIDCDHGIQSLAELNNWMFKNHLPETLTIQSGREGEAGFHLYYFGARATAGFNLDGVTGELKSNGGYVVGPGSRHPSGQLYKIVNDIAIAPFPEAAFLAKPEYESQEFPAPGLPAGTLVPASQRNGRLFQLSMKLLNLHLGEDAIFTALDDFARNQ